MLVDEVAVYNILQLKLHSLHELNMACMQYNKVTFEYYCVIFTIWREECLGVYAKSEWNHH